jgi:hypothetical protein
MSHLPKTWGPSARTGPISRTEVAIEQLSDFFSRARLLDPVQRSKDMLLETAVRIGRLAHLRFSGRNVDLLRGAHLCSVWLQLATASFTNIRTSSPQRLPGCKN